MNHVLEQYHARISRVILDFMTNTFKCYFRESERNDLIFREQKCSRGDRAKNRRENLTGVKRGYRCFSTCFILINNSYYFTENIWIHRLYHLNIYLSWKCD